MSSVFGMEKCKEIVEVETKKAENAIRGKFCNVDFLLKLGGIFGWPKELNGRNLSQNREQFIKILKNEYNSYIMNNPLDNIFGGAVS